MPRRRSALAVLTLVLVSLVLPGAAGPAWAGGPTSVLLVVPGAGQTASLYTGSTDYERLADLVGAFESAPTKGADGTHESGAGVTLTWLIHDVQVWRVDRVYLDADGGPWISTQASFDGNIWDTPEVWHVADRGKELSSLLDGLLAPGAARADAVTDTADAAVARPPAEQPGTGEGTGADTNAAQAAAATEIRWGVTGLVGLVGLALGAALTLLGLRRFSLRRPAPADDLPPRLDDPAADAEFPMTDRLSWRTPAR